MDKVLSTESIVKNLGDYIKVAYKYVETDVSLSDAVKYANYITKVDTDKISMETLPGAGQYVGGVSYFVHDPEATRETLLVLDATTGQNAISQVKAFREETDDKLIVFDNGFIFNR